MRTAALLMMVSGALIAVASCVLLHTYGLRLSFCAAALTVQAVGLVVLLHAYRDSMLEQTDERR